jgi:predicted PolB exonuclease-like 3'-5' exonuclease
MIAAFDIETIPNRDMIPFLPEPEVALGNLVDPAKIAAKIEKARADQVGEMALDPLYGRVLCWSIVDENDCASEGMLKDFTDESERNLLAELFFDHLNNPEVRLATWNGNGFDLPFIYRRAVALGLSPKAFGAPTLTHWTKKYNTDHHVDLMQVWSGFGTNYSKLDSVARAVLGDGKTEIDVAKFVEMFNEEGGREKILNYNLQDTRLVMRLFSRISGVLF